MPILVVILAVIALIVAFPIIIAVAIPLFGIAIFMLVAGKFFKLL